MQNTSEVLLRNEHVFGEGSNLILGLSDAHLLTALDVKATLVTNNWANFQLFIGQSVDVHFTHDFTHNTPIHDCHRIIIVLPKSRRLLDFWLSQLRHVFKQGTPVFLVGEKNGGIQGASKQLKAHCNNVVKLDMARHCQLWRGELLESQSFDLKDWHTEFNVASTLNALHFQSIPGVFNEGALDMGSQLLLENMGRVRKGRILDFGCGAGVIGLHAKAAQPDADVELLDVSAEAVYASKASAALNDMDVTVFASNGLSEVKGRYHQVFSNPPFHTGVKTDYSIAEAFFKGIASHMVEGGELRIVANSFLKYPPIIEQYIGPCEVVAKTKQFHIYSARKK